MRNNTVVFHFNGNVTNKLINFIVTDSRLKQDHAVEPNKIAVKSDYGCLTLTVDVISDINRDVANWYGNFVNNNEDHMVHTLGDCNSPDELYFALKGILSIGDQQYKVCIGQSPTPPHSQWHLCSQAILAGINNETANLDNCYLISAISHYEFSTCHISSPPQNTHFSENVLASNQD